MKVYHFTEQSYPPAWENAGNSLRIVLPNRRMDPKIAGDLFHRYYDEWQLCDELGLDIMLNEHHSTATCMSSTCIVGLSILARITRKARLLVLGYPLGHRPDPLRCAEELATVDVISRGRLDMGFVKGVPYEFAPSNQNPVRVMDRFWEAHDFIIKAMSSHDAPFNWESEFFHYRHVNVCTRACWASAASRWRRSAPAMRRARSTTPTAKATSPSAASRRAPTALPISASSQSPTTRRRRTGAA